LVIATKRVQQATRPVHFQLIYTWKTSSLFVVPLPSLHYRFLGSARFNAMLPRVRRGLEKDAMGRRRLVNSRSRRLVATHWRHSKCAANLNAVPTNVGLGEVGGSWGDVGGKVHSSPRCILCRLTRRATNDTTKTKQRDSTDCNRLHNKHFISKRYMLSQNSPVPG
jgi:hypothetical protein